MKTRDLLNDIADQKLDEVEAQRIISESLRSAEAANTAHWMGFSRTEWTAFGQGAGLSEIASWRRFGWPTICKICSAPIEVNSFGWQLVDVDGVSRLRHVRCPNN